MRLRYVTALLVTLVGISALYVSKGFGREWPDQRAADGEEAVLNKAALLFSSGKTDEAAGVCSEVLTRNPECLRAYWLRGAARFVNNRHSEALADSNQILKRDPKNRQGLSLRGAIFVSMEQYDEAVRLYTRMAEADPKDAEALVQRAACLMQLDKWDDAMADLNRAVQMSSRYAQAYRLRADCRARRRDLAGVAADLAVAVKYDSGDWESCVKLARILSRAKDDKLRNGLRAAEYAERAVKATKALDYEALDSLASAYAEIGRFQEAVDAEENALKLAEGSAFADTRAMRQRLERYRAKQPCRE
jgi:tetratricopeptide (TPR) repeat protein